MSARGESYQEVLKVAARHSQEWLNSVPSRGVNPEKDADEIASQWLLEILGLPSTADVGFPTGGMMANFTGLISARQKSLTDVGWDLNRKGLFGAPAIRVLVGRERHDTVDRALGYLGLGGPTEIAHKTLNVPYDCGVAIVAHPAAIRSAYGVHESYMQSSQDDKGDPMEFR